MCLYVSACMCEHVCMGAVRRQKRVLDSLELEIHVVVTLRMRMLETEFRSFVRATRTFNH